MKAPAYNPEELRRKGYETVLADILAVQIASQTKCPECDRRQFIVEGWEKKGGVLEDTLTLDKQQPDLHVFRCRNCGYSYQKP